MSLNKQSYHPISTQRIYRQQCSPHVDSSGKLSRTSLNGTINDNTGRKGSRLVALDSVDDNMIALELPSSMLLPKRFLDEVEMFRTKIPIL